MSFSKTKISILTVFILVISVNLFAQNSIIIDVKGLTAKSFFIKLSEYKNSSCENVITISEEFSENWVTKDDVEYLISFVKSEEKIACLNSMVSSLWPTECSTLGGQAMDLIDAFRFKTKYLKCLYSCTKTDLTRADEIIKWWNNK